MDKEADKKIEKRNLLMKNIFDSLKEVSQNV
jgi:hypothetical protein